MKWATGESVPSLKADGASTDRYISSFAEVKFRGDNKSLLMKSWYVANTLSAIYYCFYYWLSSFPR
jgi:hypothetical protein